MGTNRRYAHHYDRLMDQRILEGIARDGELQGLTNEEIGIGKYPLTRDPNPSDVKAWVRFGSVPIVVDAQVVAWTPAAMAIRFTVAGVEYKTWVWAGAVSDVRPARQGR
ncbi:hypothetical protein FJ657_05375 [Schumannella soli]|uniref:Uncharacterized protein n=2 Tax=Schumannella soli TaxID=2590779 RepID=A0A506YA86_9MICO|nr:hypothetical protein FJ657_05375 [Schumannella soli]